MTSSFRLEAGQKVRHARECLGLTMREVEEASVRIAEEHHNTGFAIPLSRLSDIELKGIVPSIHRCYSLSEICRVKMNEILSWYGVPSGKGEQLTLTFETQAPPASLPPAAWESLTGCDGQYR